MDREMIIGVPGPWDKSSDLVSAVVTATQGEFMYAAQILAHPSAKDHVPVDFYEADPQMSQAFRYAGQGKISDETLNLIENHKGTAYLHFPLEFITQRERIKKFTNVVKQAGGYAIKIESTGIAHEWDRWAELLDSDNLFDAYCACVVLIGDEDYYYSCGMHHFGLPDAQVSRSFDVSDAADILNDFHLYQLSEEPKMEPGHTFSRTPDGGMFRLQKEPDPHFDPDDLFHNTSGLWTLDGV